MTPRIVIHAGFHKTGTTSAQTALRLNTGILSPHVRIFLKEDFLPLTKAARALSVDPTSDNLKVLTSAAADFFGQLDPEDDRPILMSSEDLSGIMPGRRTLQAYDCAPLIMKCLADAVEEKYGTLDTLVFCFSIRDRQSWLESTWWQNLRSTRLTKGLNAYSQRLDKGATLEETVKEIAHEVEPAFVASFALEQVGDNELGPVSALLDFVDIAENVRRDMTPVAPENVRPGNGIEGIFLALNRSALPDKDVSELKRMVRRMARKSEPE